MVLLEQASDSGERSDVILRFTHAQRLDEICEISDGNLQIRSGRRQRLGAEGGALRRPGRLRAADATCTVAVSL